MIKFYFGEIAAGSKRFCDQITFTEFMDQCGWRLLFGFLQEETPRLPREELQHELLIAAARSMNAYDARRMDCKLTTYVWESWRNVVKMAYRRGASCKQKDAENVDSLGEEHESIRDTTDYEDTVLDRMDKERRARILRRVLNDPSVLNEKEKIIVELTMDGFSQNQIGKAIQTSQGEVSKTYHQALGKLKDALLAAGI